MSKLKRICLGSLLAVMALTILFLSLSFYFYRQEVELGRRDGMWGEWYYARPSYCIGFVSRDFGSFDYDICAEDIHRLNTALEEAFPEHRIIVPNPAEFDSIHPLILRRCGTPDLSGEDESRAIDIIIEWQESIIRSRPQRGEEPSTQS